MAHNAGASAASSKSVSELPPILQIGDVLISSDILTEEFCCDLDACKGECCIEGDAGAPLKMDEIAVLEEQLDDVWQDMTSGAKAVVNAQGVAYTDREGELVTSIVDGRDCVFCQQTACGARCLIEKVKPISCALYPIREKTFNDGTVGLNYHRWKVCQAAVKKGKELHLPLYRFLKGPLTRRFGEKWYKELCEVAQYLEKNC